jgi:hypothetical protein
MIYQTNYFLATVTSIVLGFDDFDFSRLLLLLLLKGKNVMNVTAGVLQKLLAALNECTEWVSPWATMIIRMH